MKKASLLILVSSLFFISCSSDDEVMQNPIPTDGNDIPTVYQPIKIANYWNYETENIPVTPAGTTTIGQDKVVVDSDVTLNTFLYKKMKTEASPTGFYGNMLNNNNLRIDGSSLKLSGSITANLDASLPLEFNVNDFVVFKENGVANEVLSQTTPASFTNTTLLPGATLTFTYSLKSTCLGEVAPMNVKGINYNNVKKTRIEVELRVTALNGGIEVDLLSPSNQKVIISDQFYAKNIGVIKANTIIQYNLALTLPDIPQQGRQEINDYLLNHFLN